MIFYIATIIILVGILLHQYVTFIRIYYTNKTVEKLREIRYSTTLHLIEIDKTKLSKDHLNLYKGFIGIVDFIIGQTNKMKNRFIKFKDLNIFFVFIKILAREKGVISLAVEGNIFAEESLANIRDVMSTSVKAIPFFYFRFFLFSIKAVLYYLLIKIGIKTLKKEYENIQQILAFYKMVRKRSLIN